MKAAPFSIHPRSCPVSSLSGQVRLLAEDQIPPTVAHTTVWYRNPDQMAAALSAQPSLTQLNIFDRLKSCRSGTGGRRSQPRPIRQLQAGPVQDQNTTQHGFSSVIVTSRESSDIKPQNVRPQTAVLLLYSAQTLIGCGLWSNCDIRIQSNCLMSNSESLLLT